MKKQWLIIVPLLGATIAAVAQPDLVAEVYPDAVEVAFWAENRELKRTEGFYTKADIEEVRAFYEQKYGPMQNDYLYGQSLGAQKGIWPFVFSKQIMSMEEVRNYVTILPEPAGVELRALDPEQYVAPYAHRAVEPYFEMLRQVVAVDEADQEEYKEAEEQFRHLAWLYYQKTEEVDESGKRLTMDQVIYRRCRDAQQQGMSEEELAAKLQKLYMAGKFDEAQELSERAGGYRSWDHWIGCLEELEEQAYKTLIVIHKHPSDWKE